MGHHPPAQDGVPLRCWPKRAWRLVGAWSDHVATTPAGVGPRSHGIQKKNRVSIFSDLVRVGEVPKMLAKTIGHPQMRNSHSPAEWVVFAVDDATALLPGVLMR